MPSAQSGQRSCVENQPSLRDITRLTIIVHSKREDEATTLIHALIRLDREREVEDIIWIRERCLHG